MLVMATSSKLVPVGYECEFVDQVPEDYFCKQCKHVAREPTIASCCTEVFCQACIETFIQDKKPCPSCESTDIANLGPHKKYRALILASTVRCSLKARGCEWTGQLRLLDAHLDLTTGDCVYVDVNCPSKCNQKVQKCNVDTHLADHCPNRDYTCPHCSFNATFREVSEHFEVCRYYPLVCPNRCGASFERDVLEDHMKMCSLQEVQCEFSYAGCEAEFIRDQQKEHMEQNTQKHLALVAATTLRISQTFEQKLKDKDSEIKVIVNNEASQLVSEQRRQSDEQIRGLQEKLQEQQQKLEQKDQQIKRMADELNSLHIHLGLSPYYFTISNFRHEKAENNKIDVQSMYTHPGGYKFHIRLRLNGPARSNGRNTRVGVWIFACESEHQKTLKYPAEFTVTLELLNQHRDQDHHTRDIQCEVVSKTITIIGLNMKFISHTDLEWNEDKQTQYLKNDCLKFRVHVTNIQ